MKHIFFIVSVESLEKLWELIGHMTQQHLMRAQRPVYSWFLAWEKSVCQSIQWVSVRHSSDTVLMFGELVTLVIAWVSSFCRACRTCLALVCFVVLPEWCLVLRGASGALHLMRPMHCTWGLEHLSDRWRSTGDIQHRTCGSTPSACQRSIRH